MPYIEPKARLAIDAQIEKMRLTCSPGELNYMMTRLAVKYILCRPESYAVLNEVVGVFESAKAEFQRRVVVPYEELKRSENGDVF